MTHGRHNAALGDNRSHGFLYRAQNADNGVLGLPVAGKNNAGREQASALLLRNRPMDLTCIGELASRSRRDTDDGCRASCAHWHGNTRPIFAGERVFALPAYEPVEGHGDRQHPRKRHRTDVPPRPATAC